MVLQERPYKVIGTRPIRPDGADKVTGRAQYGADIRLTGMLYGRVLRSPIAHGRIVRIDTSRAEALEGVKAVVTGRDLPAARDVVEEMGEAAANLRDLSNNVLAHDKVVYRGHAVAAVAATNPHIALEALSLIEVEYEPLPPLLEVRDAMREDAPLIKESQRTKSLAGLSEKPSNIAQHIHLEQGDVDDGFAKADIVVEREFTNPMFHQGYIEPHASTAFWNNDGNVTIWTTTQAPFPVRQQVCDIIGLPPARVKIVPTEIGGGFGGKTLVYLEPAAAILSRKSGKPVKLQMDRWEVFEGTGPTSGTWIKAKIGATKDGQITAAEATLAYEAGAFAGAPVGAGAQCMFTPYDIPAIKVDGYDVLVNKPKVAAYRAPGAPQAAFAAEQLIDELAEKLDIDPLQFRLRNASKEGTRIASGNQLAAVGNVACVSAALASPHYNAPLEGPNRGRGVASGFWFNVGLKSSVSASVNSDGSVTFVEGNPDIGGTRASLSMQLAETLGIPAEAIKPTVADTDSVGYNDLTAGSRTTVATGYAAYEAGMDIRRQMIARAAQIWEVPPDQVEYRDGGMHCTSDASKSMTFNEMAAQVLKTGAGIVGHGEVALRGVGGSFATHIVDVEVDPETGKVEILRYTAVQDAGTAVHPSYVEGQMQGGVAQGVGAALNEEYFWDESGHMQNSSFLDYRMPVAPDLPMIEAVIVEEPFPGHPYGVRGVGEVPIVPPLPAIANAIYRATGVRFTDLPISPRRILEQTLNLEG
jgi:xanthine dehydrogenase molybdenum-binding subunit